MAAGRRISQSLEQKDTPYRIDFLVALISLLFPLGYSVSGFDSNIVLACTCWTITLCAFLHYIWAWSAKSGKYTRLTLCIIIGLPLFVLAIAWKPVKERYRIQHSPPVLNSAEKTLNAKFDTTS